MHRTGNARLGAPDLQLKRGEMMLPRKAFSVLAGVGLLLGSAVPAFAQTSSMTPQAQAEAAIRSFCAQTNRDWSMGGFASAAGAREILGNNQSDWFTQTLKMAGLSGCPTR
jgi:hypothetical protein